jgi:putative transposase
MFDTYEHCVVGAYLHLQFTPAYRRDIFCDAVLIRFCRLEFQRIARKLGVSIVACAFGPNHTHVFIRGWKNYAIAYLANRFKGGSSHYLRETFWERVKTKLWATNSGLNDISPKVLVESPPVKWSTTSNASKANTGSAKTTKSTWKPTKTPNHKHT